MFDFGFHRPSSKASDEKYFEVLKKIVIWADQRFQDFIGSKSLEHLRFHQEKSRVVDWNFIASLERLKILTIESFFT